MKIDVDRDKCTGHARCYATAPQVYVLDDDGYNVGGRSEVPAEFEAAARDGAAACPESAITIID